MTTLKHKILESVKKEDITMTPKWKFVLYSSCAIFGIIFIFTLLVFVESFLIFILSRYGFMYLPFFELLKAIHTFNAVPYVLLVSTIILLFTVEGISRYYSLSFRRPLIVTLIGVAVIASLVSVAISSIGVHEYVRTYAKNNHMKMIGKVYGRPAPFKKKGDLEVARGEVSEVSKEHLSVMLFDGTITISQIATTTQFRNGYIPVIGDDVVIVGNFVGGVFLAKDIHIAKRGNHFIQDMQDRKENKGMRMK